MNSCIRNGYLTFKLLKLVSYLTRLHIVLKFTCKYNFFYQIIALEWYKIIIGKSNYMTLLGPITFYDIIIHSNSSFAKHTWNFGCLKLTSIYAMYIFSSHPNDK